MAFEDDLRAFALGAMERLSVPGASIGITTPDNRTIMPLGITALDTQFAVRPDTIFQVGSISKPFTATLVMALVDAGKLDLDATVVSYLPEFRLGSKKAAQQITLRHLLTHQAGFWGDWFDDFGLADDATERFCAEYWRLPQLFEPGEMWAYNNCGYILAGHIAAKAAGTTFEAAIEQYILDPLEMDHTFLSAADAIAYPIAVGHTNNAETGAAEIARQFRRPRVKNPSGGILTSVVDLLAFAELNLGRRSCVLSSDSVQRMQDPTVSTYEIDTAWSPGFRILHADGTDIVGHLGGSYGYSARLELIPTIGLGIAVMTNSSSGHQLGSELVDWIIKQIAGISLPAPVQVVLPDQDKARLEGTYCQPDSRVEIGALDAGLGGRFIAGDPSGQSATQHSGPSFSMRYLGEQRFMIADGSMKGLQMKFWTHPDGTVRFLQSGGELFVLEGLEYGEGATAT